MTHQKFKHGYLSKIKREKKSYGSKGSLFSKWSESKISCHILEIERETTHNKLANKNAETLYIVKSGSGILHDGKNAHKINKKTAFKVYPGKNPIMSPNGKITLITTELPLNKKEQGVKSKYEIKVINMNKIKSKVYEFETLAEEVFTPKEKGLGLIRFDFVNPIPIHKHPNSGRIILPISGKGVTYIEPNLYEANEDTFALFDKNTTHTNGPIGAQSLELYAVQMPWVESKIDKENIAGCPKFVKYVGATPPKQLWKKKEDMQMLLKKLKN